MSVHAGLFGAWILVKIGFVPVVHARDPGSFWR